MTVLSNIFFAAGILFAFFGMVGLFRFKHFYARILITSNIDSAGMLLMMIGGVLCSPSAAFAFKIVIIAVLILITGPLSTHAILRSARNSGYGIKPGESYDRHT